ncbi:MAG: isopenicillin N synthase family oxygenase [Burkholderiales bacterium]|nr:isopenicillin N synthase family oxygenase [Burkholderiales bacterium]
MTPPHTALQARTRTLDRNDLSARALDFDAIPIVDIAGLRSPDAAARRGVADAIGRACRDVGFLYVTGHGIAQADVDAVFATADAFFAQPLAVKQRVAITRTGRHRGWVALGGLAADAHDASAWDLQEGFELSLELPADDPDHLAGNPMLGPNIWPDTPAAFRPVVYGYFEQVLALGRLLFRGFALALDLPETWFEPYIRKPMAQLRVLRYPPQPEPFDPKHIGVGAHTDYECFTILATSAPGLQVQNARGEWIAAPPVPGAFVINIGDVMARWTNDVFRSTVHRVINQTGAQRFSLPFFFGADHAARIECLPTCTDATHPPLYPPVTAGEWTESNIALAYAYRNPKVG